MAFTITSTAKVPANLGVDAIDRKFFLASRKGSRNAVARRNAAMGVSGGEVTSQHPDALRRREEAQARSRESSAERQEMVAQMQGRSFIAPPENLYEVESVSDLKSHIALGAKNDFITVVNFKARWCMKCAKLQYTIKKTAEENENIRFLNVDVTNVSGELGRYCKEIGLKSIPYFQVYEKNKIISEGKWTAIRIPGIKSK